MRFLIRLTLMAVLAGAALYAQALDTSGTSMLKGTYRFRHLIIPDYDSNGNATEATGFYGTIVFDGNGNYTASGAYVDNTVSGGAPQPYSTTGTYGIGANGFGYIDNPLYDTEIWGSVAQGVFIGSSTEADNDLGFTIDDLFAAVPSGTPSNSNFKGPYWVGLLDFKGASSASINNALFQLSPNGSSGFGTIILNGQSASQSASSLTQTVTGAAYSFPGDGSISLTIPAPSGVTTANALFTGNKTVILSADGNFFVGWTPGGYDMFFGVRAISGSASTNLFQGTYFSAGLENAPASGNSSGCGNLDSFYGSVGAASGGNEIVHQRLATPYCYSYDNEFDDQTQINADGSATDFNGYDYGFGDNGLGFVAIGTAGEFSLQIGISPGTFSGTGVFLNPVGIVNSASFSPITMSVAPGEAVSLFGSGLSSVTMPAPAGQALPTTLGGVQVLVNGTAAPLSYVSPGLINAVLPYEIANSSTGIANIQVSNNGSLSHTVSMFITDAAPGAFSQTANGIGYAIAWHTSNGSLVTPKNPAQAGEYLAVYLSGLGTVTPNPGDGVPAPSGTASNADINTSGNLSVQFDDYNNGAFQQANIEFAGLAPQYPGIYQMNLQVPSGVGPGDVYLELITDNADVNQILIPVGSGTQARSAVAEHAVSRAGTRRRAVRKARTGKAGVARRAAILRRGNQ